MVFKNVSLRKPETDNEGIKASVALKQPSFISVWFVFSADLLNSRNYRN